MAGEQQVLEDYYLSIEMAKHIALHSRSKVKMKYARRLQELLDEEGGGHPLAKEGLQELISLTKTLCMRSSQEHAEQRHLEAYRSRNSGSSANWWLYRAHAMGYSALSLRQQMSEAGPSLTIFWLWEKTWPMRATWATYLNPWLGR